MSLRDLLAATLEELVGILALDPAAATPLEKTVARRIRTSCFWVLMLSGGACAVCWVAALALPNTRVGGILAILTYATFAVAIFAALGWALVGATLARGVLRRGRDA